MLSVIYRDERQKSYGSSSFTSKIFADKCLPLAEQIFCLTVPEKATRQRNYVIIPKGGDGVTTSTDDGATNGAEPIVWTVPETAPKTVTLGAGVDAGSGADGDANTTADDETYVSVISRAIKEGWGRRREVVTPRKEEFVSALTESHRKGEPAWHVKAFRGSKEGKFGHTHTVSFCVVFLFMKPYYRMDTLPTLCDGFCLLSKT